MTERKKIYVNFEAPPTIGEFLKKFFSINYGIILTQKAVETYHDKECSVVQCYENKYRSFDNMLDIINTYYPDTTPKQLIHELLVADVRDCKGRPLAFHMGSCEDIQRIRICYYWEHVGESPFEQSKYKSKWSWEELLNMLEIYNTNDLKAYIDKHKVIDPPYVEAEPIKPFGVYGVTAMELYRVSRQQVVISDDDTSHVKTKVATN